ncbi:MAG: GAF domain-containing protein [Gammaproteobacteria bacterium]|nr:GAF domain-containing protein [Gammaproteobacteria bacterium]MBU2059954.1 GAF domain-containing protein [Gammaproteobacteria bacterium]MBU2175791.1 GAF domain-containing protein [Gammaproteobacteria bacterium]MBU2247614.1 GAF domain-containing protein [Gammaproteobacteria bacterium]MBU2342929.1 GAF domain-containing protein [Gammaproteobacteria bacterium]
MQVAAVPQDEQNRLKALLKLQILDTEPDATFDAVTALAATLFQVPIALVSLIDEQRQWFKSKQGLDVCQTERKLAFCAHAILQPDIFIVEDASQDERFADNPLVCTIPNIRFYAGCPLINEQGYALGTLCIISPEPRQMTEQDKVVLRQMAALVMERLNEHKQKLQTEHKLQLLDLLLDSIPDALVACDSEGQLEQFNKVARDWHCVDVRQCDPELWSHYYDLYEEDGQTVLSVDRIPLLRAFHGEPVVRQDICIKAKGLAPRWARCRGEQLKSRSGQLLGALVLMQDISEQKRLEQMKTDFISTVSHELRTPITAISGALDLVIHQVLGSVPEKALAMLKVASQNSKRLQLLVNDLLDMEKLSAGKMDFYLQPCDLAQECQQAITQNQPYADRFAVQLSLLNNESLMMQLDSHRLQQVLSNLLSNAIKYSKSGAEVFLSYYLLENKIRIQVEDKGEGIPLHFQEKIFQRFAQADGSDSKARSGTGLGLAISRAIIESMGGTIDFRSVPGQGSVFYCDFPVCSE